MRPRPRFSLCRRLAGGTPALSSTAPPAMKPIVVALLAAFLSGCATESWRFADDRLPPPRAVQTAPIDSRQPDNTSARSLGAHVADNPNAATAGRTMMEGEIQPPSKRPIGLIDPLVDRIPALLSGTMLDPARSGGAFPMWRPSPGAGAPDPYSVQAAAYFADLGAAKPASFEQPAHSDVVFLPDAAAGQCPSGQSAIWVGVEGADGNPVDVVIQDPPVCQPPRSFFQRSLEHPLVYNLVSDQRNFYSCCSLEWLAAGLGTSAILANTNLDEEFRQSIHGPVHKDSTNLNWMKDLGTGQYVIPALVGIWAADAWIDSTAPGERPIAESLEAWSGRSLRGLMVGAVPVIALQSIIGSSRPGESSAGSRWKPFQDNNGVSGHAFVGAVPFWTAAQMTDCIPLEAGFYAMGSLAGIARLQNDSHYLSQVVMGWWIAGLSVAAVDCTEWQKRSWQVMPMITDSGAGMALMHQW